MSRLTEKVTEIGTGKVLAYTLKSGVKPLTAVQRLGEFEDAESTEDVKNAYVRGYNQGTIDRAEEVTKAREQGYMKAIDEFAEKLLTDVEGLTAEVNGTQADVLTLDYFTDFVLEAAEQMKKGGAE